MKTTVTEISISCDCCGKKGIQPARLLWRETFGFRPIQAVGIDIIAEPFGEYCEHVCDECVQKALRALIAALEKQP